MTTVVEKLRELVRMSKEYHGIDIDIWLSTLGVEIWARTKKFEMIYGDKHIISWEDLESMSDLLVYKQLEDCIEELIRSARV